MSKPPPEFVIWYILPKQKEFRERVNEEKEKLGWDIGDWLIFNANEYCHRMDAGDHVGIVCEVLTAEKSNWGLNVRDLTPSKGWGPHRLLSLKGHDVRWLPSLSDLLNMVEAGWPYIEITICRDEERKAHIWAATESVDWSPDGCGFWRCNECGDILHDQPGGTQTYGAYPEKLDDEVWDAWNGGADLPVCPHCAEARAKTLKIAAASLLRRLWGVG